MALPQLGDSMAAAIAEIVQGVEGKPLEELDLTMQEDVRNLICGVVLRGVQEVPEITVEKPSVRRQPVPPVPAPHTAEVVKVVPCIDGSMRFSDVAVVSTLFTRPSGSEVSSVITPTLTPVVSSSIAEESVAVSPQSPKPAALLHQENRQKVEGWYKDRLYRERATWTAKNDALLTALNTVIEEKAEVERMLLEAQRAVMIPSPCRNCKHIPTLEAERDTLRSRVTALDIPCAACAGMSTRFAALEAECEVLRKPCAPCGDMTKRLAVVEGERDGALKKVVMLEAECGVLRKPCEACGDVTRRLAVVEGERDVVSKKVVTLEAECGVLRSRVTALDVPCGVCVGSLQDLAEMSKRFAALEDGKDKQSARMHALREENKALAGQCEKERSCAAELDVKLMEIQAQLQGNVGDVQRLADCNKNLTKRLEVKTQEFTTLQRENEKLAAWGEQLEECERKAQETGARQLDVLKRQVGDAERKVKAAGVENSKLQEKYSTILQKDVEGRDIAGTLEDITNRYIEERSLRRKYYNQLVVLRGNIRVMCRLKPSQDEPMPHTVDNDGLTVTLKNGKTRVFKFDAIILGNTTQEKVYSTSGEDLIQSLLDGYNVCVMAYGQTGSGKTYTMFGGEGFVVDDAAQGLVPRCLKDFWNAASMQPNTNFTAAVSMVEIYCGEVRDLLGERDGDVVKYMMGSEAVTHKVVPVEGLGDCFNLIEGGYKVRSVAATLCNTRSSRSHCLVTLHYKSTLKGKGLQAAGEISSRMVLADLGGSECVTTAGLSGIHVRECSHINKSLSALSDVLTALNSNRAHIPYRNSKLTHILSDSLGGDAKMLLFTTINPSKATATETLHTLSFGHRARQIKRGPTTRHFTAAERSLSPEPYAEAP